MAARLQTHGLSDGYVVDNVIAPQDDGMARTRSELDLRRARRRENYDSPTRRAPGVCTRGEQLVDPVVNVHMAETADAPAETLLSVVPAASPSDGRGRTAQLRVGVQLGCRLRHPPGGT